MFLLCRFIGKIIRISYQIKVFVWNHYIRMVQTEVQGVTNSDNNRLCAIGGDSDF